jgi:hypothetical protein
VQVQTAMDFEMPNNGLSLPSNFPEVLYRNTQSALQVPLNLKLTTSNLQKSVTASLKQIGFYHDVEHTITMKEMADLYSIIVPPSERH